MTEKEYEEAIATQNAIIHSHEKEIRVARSKKGEVTEAFCQSLSERYADFIGKKVKVEFNGYKPVVGFLMKFKKACGCEKIYPVIAKVKKDGTASLNCYMDYKMPSYKFISNIKIIE